MRITLRAILPLVVLAVAPTVAEAQRGFPGSVRSSPRPLVDEGQSDGAGVGAGGPDFSWLLGTAGDGSDKGSSFSALAGFELELARPLSLEGTFTYQRSVEDELDPTNAYEGTLKATLKWKTRDSLEINVAATGELGQEVDVERSYSIGTSASVTFWSSIELGGSVAYKGTDPDESASTWGWSPGLLAMYHPNDKTTVGVEYTFENDVDGEEKFEFLGTYEVTPRAAPPFQLEFGVDDKGTIGAGIIFTF